VLHGYRGFEARKKVTTETPLVPAVYCDAIIELLIEHAATIHQHTLEPFHDVRSITEHGEEPMEKGRCLANAILYASWHEDDDLAGYQVVVGYAHSPGKPEPYAHAWVVDPDGQAWDVTWTDVGAVNYRGVALRTTSAAECMERIR